MDLLAHDGLEDELLAAPMAELEPEPEGSDTDLSLDFELLEAEAPPAVPVEGFEATVTDLPLAAEPAAEVPLSPWAPEAGLVTPDSFGREPDVALPDLAELPLVLEAAPEEEALVSGFEAEPTPVGETVLDLDLGAVTDAAVVPDEVLLPTDVLELATPVVDAAFVPEVEPVVLQTAEPVVPAALAPVATPSHLERVGDLESLDPELFALFAEEGKELLPQLGEQMRAWEDDLSDMGRAALAMRSLHTFKGSARMAGAMQLGELAHRLETSIEEVLGRGALDAGLLQELQTGVDTLSEQFDRLLRGEPHEEAQPLAESGVAALEAPVAEVLPRAELPAPEVTVAAPFAIELPQVAEPEPVLPAAVAAVGGQVDWAQLALRRASSTLAAGVAQDAAAQGTVRVKAPLLDRMVSHAGEVGITRARIASDMGQMQNSLRELTDNLERLRRQLRDLEIQAETQMTSRMEAARQLHQSFDPLEMDRFTRVQELTRMLAESVNDVGTVQRGLVQTLQDAEDQLANQLRLTRDLQDDLLRARMVEFDNLSDRLYRVVRQSAKDTGKLVRLNLVGGSIELDRAVLDRMAAPFEHLLRNAVAHGIETPAHREAAGKPASGHIEVSLHQIGNEVQIEVRDDGAGLDLARIEAKARAAGLVAPDAQLSEAELAGMIFRSGFSTASVVTEVAGRGVGMDVVRAEVTAMGGRIETATSTGQGTTFRLVLPLTTAVTQVVVLDAGGPVVAVPATLVELVRRVPVAEVEAAYRTGVLRHGEREIPFFWLGSLLQDAVRGQVEGRTAQVVIVRSAAQYVALHVAAVSGNQEAVVKNLGTQLSRLPGLAGMSLLPTGGTVLIYNPVALAAVYGQDIRRRLQELQAEPVGGETQPAAAAALASAAPVQPAEAQPALVMVVDDSLTVRRVTQRLLQREGYRVLLAKDGLDALEKLVDERPVVMLCDIEMPRMDGFDLVRNLRSDPRLADLPVIMITSRIAQKHREHAHELGVDHYLGKPYDEDLLLGLVRDYAGVTVAA
ncbi:response regulator [Ideonella sp. TBM-1]|uniref:Chemotaxis protein CheA n=2 Tax=Ideonella livida TaxID=2707176 RepID=A0A7C9TL55_9BURK|nr:response regulator [Ideonella livida]